MRKIIIDTDTGSDDAVALIMGFKSEDVKIEAVTMVAGNVPLHQATQNALMTMEVTDAQKPPVYMGAKKPLFKNLHTAGEVHGLDGMGDCNLIDPTIQAEKDHAVDKILEIVEANPHEIEILTIGPVTNIATAILKSPETMKKVKRIYAMGTGGFGLGNTTPVAEFNVYVDAEAYEIMLKSEIPVKIIGFDLCLLGGNWNKKDIEFLSNSKKNEARFAIKCNKKNLEWNLKEYDKYQIGLPDPLALGVLLWDDIVLEEEECYSYVCYKEEATYGQVIFYNKNYQHMIGEIEKYPKVTVCKNLNYDLYKQRMIDLITK